MAQLGVGIIGAAGSYASRDSLLGFQANPHTQVTAVCDLNADVVKQIARGNSIPYWSTDYHALLAREDVQIVVVDTPDHLHAEHAIAALAAGKHVLCAKPMCTTLDQCRALVEAVDRSGRSFMVQQSARWDPVHWRIHELYADGAIGEAFAVEGSYMHSMYDYWTYGMTPWRWDPDGTPQNLLIGGCCHPLDLLKWTVGCDIEEAFAYSTAYPKAISQPGCYFMIFRFTNGCVGKTMLNVGLYGPIHGYGEGLLTIYGSRGTIYRDMLFRPGREPQKIEPAWIDAGTQAAHGSGTNRSVDHFVDCILNGGEPLVHVRDAAKTTAALIAGTESALTGQPVKVFNSF
jgi:UDP-N-acetylglucosamine 3-dehydrogenase